MERGGGATWNNKIRGKSRLCFTFLFLFFHESRRILLVSGCRQALRGEGGTTNHRRNWRGGRRSSRKLRTHTGCFRKYTYLILETTTENHVRLIAGRKVAYYASAVDDGLVSLIRNFRFCFWLFFREKKESMSDAGIPQKRRRRGG